MKLLLLLLLLVCVALGSKTIVVKFSHGGVDVEHFAREHNLRHVRALGGVLAHEHVHEFEARDAKHAARFVAEEADSHQHDIEWSEQQIRRKRYTRTTDPLWRQQWHLHDSNGYGLNIERALEQGIDGRGRKIAIVDDGLDPMHPDLAPNLDLLLSRDFNGAQGTNPTPFEGDTHGTSAAGCAAAARDNNHCGVGVASNVTLLGFRLIAAGTSDLDEAEALGLHRSGVDVYSNSWGPYDDGQHMERPGRLLDAVFERGVTTGLGGRGSVFVWAGGNGKRNGDNCNYDGYANDYRTISVTAITGEGKSPWYAEPCAAHLVAAPSSSQQSGITTTTYGRGSGECTRSFGGTSAAAPMIAGVVACMRQVRPDLSWRDVQGVIAVSAIHTGVATDWSLNARGYRHSHSFGFGHLDLLTTVNKARAWTLWPPMRKCVMPTVRVQKRITQGSWLITPVYLEADSECARKINFVESVSLTVGITHVHRGQVEVTLVDPEGIGSQLARSHQDNSPNYPREGWTFTSVRHWGTMARGTWQVEVRDAVSDFATGTFDWFRLTIRGHAEGSV